MYDLMELLFNTFYERYFIVSLTVCQIYLGIKVNFAKIKNIRNNRFMKNYINTFFIHNIMIYNFSAIHFYIKC